MLQENWEAISEGPHAFLALNLALSVISIAVGRFLRNMGRSDLGTRSQKNDVSIYQETKEK